MLDPLMSKSSSRTSWKWVGSVTRRLDSIRAGYGLDSEGTGRSGSVQFRSGTVSVRSGFWSVFSSRKWSVYDGGSLRDKQQNLQTRPQNRLPGRVGSGHSRFIVPQRLHFGQNRVQNQNLLPERLEPRVDHGVRPAAGAQLDPVRSRPGCYGDGRNLSPQVVLVVRQTHRNQHGRPELDQTLLELLSHKIKPAEEEKVLNGDLNGF